MNLGSTGAACCAALAVSCAVQAPLDLAKRGTLVVVPEEARCGSSSTYEARHNCCVMQPYITGMPIELASSAAAAEYGLSAKPAPYDVEAEAYSVNHGHTHEVRPGEHYRLGGIVVPRSSPALFRGLWFGLTLTRRGPDSADVEPVYCQHSGQAMADQRAWHRAVQQSIFKTLPPVRSMP